MRRRSGSPAALAASLLLAALLDAGPAAAAGNRPPEAPTHLTVDDRTDPLAIDGVPRFGWLPRDRDGNEVQSSYQLVVTREAGGKVWDSGKVASARQSWVAYAGPALASGTSYRWTVRTWDRRGAVSPYATTASFDTGLADTDWSGAAWIRREAAGNDAANEWTLARTVVPVGTSRVVRARAYISATGDWELRVNGGLVNRGSSYGYPGEGYYDVSALAGVRAGAPLSIGVRYHYWTCRCQGRANGPRPPEGPSGLLVKIVIEHADGSRDLAVSSGQWKVAKDTAQDVATLTFRNSDAGDRVERYDARQEITGWDTAGYDDTPWTAASVIGQHPRPNPASCTGYDGNSAPCAFTHLSAQQAHLSYSAIHPVSLRRLPDGTVFADFGKVVAAVPSVSFRSGTAGRAITMTTSFRRANTTLAAPAAAGARTVTLASVAPAHLGDEITIDAPANGYGAGAPETRTIVSISPQGTEVELDAPLRRAHATGVWVETSRAGRSGLDTQGSDLRHLYTQKSGRQVAQPFTYWGWRYLEISDPGETLSRDQVTAVVQATDVRPAEAATFRSSDPTLDAVFDLMRHSALQSAQNVFLDTPTREKGQFLGDTIDQSFATMESLGERSRTREAIVEFIGSQARYWPNGALNAVYPNGDAKRDIPDYTEMFGEWVMRYHQLTGDTALVAKALPTMKRVADYLWASVDSTGLVHELPGGTGPYEHGIIDWPPPMRYDTTVADNGSRTVVNALAVGAINATADAATIAGDPATAAEYRGRADTIAAAMNDRLRDPATGRYADGLALSTGQPIPNFSQHAQSFPVAYGVTPAASHPALGGYLDGLGMRQGPMTLRQLLAALRRTGHPETILRLLTDPANDGPAQVLAEGGTFLWEQWTPGCPTPGCVGAQVNQNSSESFSHGWGAAGSAASCRACSASTSPDPARPRCRSPHRPTDCAMPAVPSGPSAAPVTVAWRRTGNGVSLEVTVPTNVTATVVLPGSRYRAFGDGEPRLVEAGQERVVYTTGSGRTHFQAVPDH